MPNSIGVSFLFCRAFLPPGFFLSPQNTFHHCNADTVVCNHAITHHMSAKQILVDTVTVSNQHTSAFKTQGRSQHLQAISKEQQKLPVNCLV